MNLRAFAEKIIRTKNSGFPAGLALLPLSLSSYIYLFIITIRSSLYHLGMLKRYSADCKTLTIGNLTVGGTGKTPTVCLIAGYLNKKGIKTAVVCRGYRGKDTARPLVVSDRQKIMADAASAGDEAYMLAKKLPGVPVIAGKDRVKALKMAVSLFNTEIILLDDGFQHLRLKRDIDIVLINSENPFGNGFLIPRGTLREPVKALKRADIILITKSGPPHDCIELKKTIQAHNPAAPVFKSVYKPSKMINPCTGTGIPAERLQDKRVSCFCSIGDPESFISILLDMGLSLTDKIFFPDHHQYSLSDHNRIKKIAERSDYLITTEKDIAKITPDMLKIENLAVLEIEEVIDNTDLFFKTLQNKMTMGK